MPVKTPPLNFRQSPNPEVLNGLRPDMSREYRDRIPEATQANISETIATLHKFRGLRNEVVDALVNRIGLEVYRDVTFNNPLAVFKKGMVPYGSTVEEVQMGLVKATVLDNDRDSLEKDVWGRDRIDVQSSFHTENRKDRYKVTLEEIALRRAFLDEYGLGNFVHQIAQAPATSDEVDEYLIMANLLVENDENGGFFRVNVADVEGGDADAARALMRQVRAWSRKLRFVSTHYNASGMPVNAQPEKLVLITTPEVEASMDVDALAAAFNMEKMDVAPRVVSLPKEDWPIAGAVAILTTEDFFQVYDTVFETRQIQNPHGLYDNLFYHHHGIISLSRFVPAVLFTTGAGDTITVTDPAVTSVTVPTITNALGATVTSAERGFYFQINSTAITTGDLPGGNAVEFTLVGAESDVTRLSNTGALLVGPDETAESLTIISTSVSDGTKSAQLVIPLSGDIAQRWPDPRVVPEP